VRQLAVLQAFRSAQIAMSKLLVVDDSRFQVEALKQALEGKGFEVSMAQDAMQAGIAIRRSAPDAVILDINIPGGSGIEVLKRIQSSGRNRRMPVIVITGNEDPQIKAQALKLGAREFLIKPVDVDSLAKALSSLLTVSS
jgi:DNA-binding NtrC family response regulator